MDLNQDLPIKSGTLHHSSSAFFLFKYLSFYFWHRYSSYNKIWLLYPYVIFFFCYSFHYLRLCNSTVQ